MDLRWKSLVNSSRESLIDLSGTGYRCLFSLGARYYFDLDLLADSLYFSSSVYYLIVIVLYCRRLIVAYFVRKVFSSHFLLYLGFSL